MGRQVYEELRLLATLCNAVIYNYLDCGDLHFGFARVRCQVPHRQWVFSIPKRLRIYFLYDRRLLAKLSQCAWKALSAYLKQGASFEDASPGAVIAVQTFGNYQNFNPHLHAIATDGCFYGSGGFAVGPTPQSSDLEEAFRLEVFKMLKKEEKITDNIIENMMGWHHSGSSTSLRTVRPPKLLRRWIGWPNL